MKTLVLGIGNTLKGDDGIGVYVAERINEHLEKVKQDSQQAESAGGAEDIAAIDCGTVVENYTSAIREHEPDLLILVDAADMGLSPGAYRSIPPEKIDVMCLSTHNIPLSLFVSYVGEFCQRVILLGIQPAGMDFGTALSADVQESGDFVAALIVEKRLDEVKVLEV
ncbi:MAG: hydrogenase maturation peptidase HycI [Chloroflexota bacterium]|nr:hydrogenase maturation peptidase HycI [Chloroflexota bacterium]